MPVTQQTAATGVLGSEVCEQNSRKCNTAKVGVMEVFTSGLFALQYARVSICFQF